MKAQKVAARENNAAESVVVSTRLRPEEAAEVERIAAKIGIQPAIVYRGLIRTALWEFDECKDSQLLELVRVAAMDA